MEERRLGRRVALVAAQSRALVLAVSVASSLVVGPYDTSARISRCDGERDVAARRAVAQWLPLGTNWDAEYFGAIAQSGYAYEQFHAFFPALPALARVGADAAGPALQGWGWSEEALVAACGVALSNACFVGAAWVLFRLGVAVLEDEAVAFRAAVLFCFTPASVFMSAFYTESLFALLSLTGMLMACRPGARDPTADLACASLCFCAATLTRSNGTLLAGYLGYRLLRPFLFGQHLPTLPNLAAAAARLALPALVASVAPLGLVLRHAASLYCSGANKAGVEDAASGASGTSGTNREREASERPWCSAGEYPDVYRFVQAEYWNVGLFNYYEPKQAPNFLLAAPALAWSAACVADGFWNSPRRRLVALLPFLLHLAAMCAICMLVMHVQVLTRFVASNPALYWFAAATPRRARWLGGFSAVYVLLGTSMFSCYYPWS